MTLASVQEMSIQLSHRFPLKVKDLITFSSSRLVVLQCKILILFLYQGMPVPPTLKLQPRNAFSTISLEGSLKSEVQQGYSSNVADTFG